MEVQCPFSRNNTTLKASEDKRIALERRLDVKGIWDLGRPDQVLW